MLVGAVWMIVTQISKAVLEDMVAFLLYASDVGLLLNELHAALQRLPSSTLFY